MHRISIAALVVLAWISGSPREVAAQSLLERLVQGLPQTTASQPLPEPLPEPPADSLQNSAAAMLGVRVTPVTEAAVRQYGLTVRRGALIIHVEVGSPADQVGLPLGGAIVAINGQRIDVSDDLVRFIRTARPQQNVELTYYHRNRMYRKTVRLGRAGVQAERANVQAERASPASADSQRTTQPTPQVPGTSIERELGGIGQRPFLGRIGRAIDQFANPEGGQLASPDPPGQVDSEVVALRQQVELLKSQVEELRRRLTALEKKRPVDNQ